MKLKVKKKVTKRYFAEFSKLELETLQKIMHNINPNNISTPYTQQDDERCEEIKGCVNHILGDN